MTSIDRSLRNYRTGPQDYTSSLLTTQIAVHRPPPSIGSRPPTEVFVLYHLLLTQPSPLLRGVEIGEKLLRSVQLPHGYCGCSQGGDSRHDSQAPGGVRKRPGLNIVEMSDWTLRLGPNEVGWCEQKCWVRTNLSTVNPELFIGGWDMVYVLLKLTELSKVMAALTFCQINGDAASHKSD